jgi:hypothetical protein
MPRISQAGIPIEQAAITPIGVDLGPAGAGLQAVGASAIRLGKHFKEEERVNAILAQKHAAVTDAIGTMRADSQRRQGVTDIDIFKQEHPDPAEWDEGVKEISKGLYADLKKLEMSDEARLSATAEIDIWAEEQEKVVRNAAIARSAEDATEAAKAHYIETMAGGDEEDIAKARELLFMILDNTVDDAERDNLIKELTEFGHEKRVERITDNIKPTLIEAVEGGDKFDGIKALDTISQQLVDEGFWTEVDAAEQNKILGDWLDNYVAGRKRQKEDAVKLTTRETYMEMNELIVGGGLSYDNIEDSDLLKADKVKWQKYIKGSYTKDPSENTPDGHTQSFDAMFDAATLQLSPTEAYDVLLTERFINKTITNAQFEWAVGKIEKPYPKNILEDLDATVLSNLKDFNRTFKRDRERNKETNEALIAWVDELIAKDQVPAFDFKKKMFAMSSQFRVGDVRWYDVGDVVERNNVEWEVVGFDGDGEPIVEEVR